MKGPGCQRLALLAGLITALLGPAANAAGDEGCGFTDSDCGTPALPFLLPDNDPRVNLMLLQSSRNHIPLPIPQPAPDQARSRIDPFTAYRVMGLAATDDDEADDDDDADPSAPPDDAAPTDDHAALLQQGRQLRLPPAVLDKLRTIAPLDMDGRWLSNDLTALSAFFDALLNDAALSDDQRVRLAQSRIDILTSDTPADDALSGLDAVPDDGDAGDLKRYLVGAATFYQGPLDRADSLFQQLTNARQPWVADTARYMLIRVALNAAIQNAQSDDNSFDPGKVDKAAAQQAVQRIDDYLKHAPHGAYAESARGLYRRAYWLLDDPAALARSFQRSLTAAASVGELRDLGDEINDKLLSNPRFTLSADAPALMLLQDLRRLHGANQPLTPDELGRQRPLFDKAGMAAEYRYLQAAALFYQQKNYAEALKTLPAASARDLTDVTAFSAQVLRGLALQQLQRWDEAEAHWRRLLTRHTGYTQQQFLQLALAQTLVDSGHPEKVFAPDSPVQNLRFRSAILKVSAGPELLRQQAGPQQTPEERAVALHTLLTKELTHGDYAGYLRDSALLHDVPPLHSSENLDWDQDDLTVFGWDGRDTEPGYQCPALPQVAAALNQNPRDAHANNCLGEFFLRTGNAVGFDWGESNMLDGLTSAKSQYPGAERNRLDGYLAVVDDQDAPTADRSYALYRAIYCYAPSGSNDCGSQQVDKPTRRAWFKRLKTEFEDSQWTERLKYYW